MFLAIFIISLIVGFLLYFRLRKGKWKEVWREMCEPDPLDFSPTVDDIIKISKERI